MSKGEVQEIVEQTILSLRRQGLLKDDYSMALGNTEPVIRGHFTGQQNECVKSFLEQYSNDIYIDIIYLHYKDSLTMEKIAEEMDKDISTVKRNKKRLIMKLHNILLRETQ